MGNQLLSDPENISTMKFLLAVALFATLACALAEPEPEAYRGYYGGYRGYGGYYGGYRGYYRGKRSADAEPKADADAWGYYGYPYAYGYGYYGHPYRYFGKRSADAEPEAEAAPWGGYYRGYCGYARPYYGYGYYRGKVR